MLEVTDQGQINYTYISRDAELSTYKGCKGVTQNPQYSKTAVLTTARSRTLRFFGDSYSYQKGITSILKDDLENIDNYLFQE